MKRRKDKPTERYRGGIQFVERHTNHWAARIGWLTRSGYSSEAIAAELADGTTSATVRVMWAKWGMQPRDDVQVIIPMTVRERAHLAARAEQQGIGIEEYILRSAMAVAMPRDRYAELVEA